MVLDRRRKLAEGQARGRVPEKLEERKLQGDR
jgi:hypothetical protein